MRGLASWDGIKLIQYHISMKTAVNALVEDREGTLWVGATFRSRDAGLLCAIGSGRDHVHRRGTVASLYNFIVFG